MNGKHWFGGGDAQTEWPELEPDPRNDKVDDPDTAPDLQDDEQEKRPTIPRGEPEPRA